MKITILDGHNVNPGDVSWDCIARFGSLAVYDRTPSALVIPRIIDSELILLNKVSITSSILDQCKKLKYLGVMATGYNVVDTAACRERGIIVTNIPSYSTDAVAQHVFAFILNFTNLVQKHSDSVQNGGWISCPAFCYWLSPLTELAGKTLGIYGFGHIGRLVINLRPRGIFDASEAAIMQRLRRAVAEQVAGATLFLQPTQDLTIDSDAGPTQ